MTSNDLGGAQGDKPEVKPEHLEILYYVSL